MYCPPCRLSPLPFDDDDGDDNAAGGEVDDDDEDDGGRGDFTGLWFDDTLCAPGSACLPSGMPPRSPPPLLLPATSPLSMTPLLLSASFPSDTKLLVLPPAPLKPCPTPTPLSMLSPCLPSNKLLLLPPIPPSPRPSVPSQLRRRLRRSPTRESVTDAGARTAFMLLFRTKPVSGLDFFVLEVLVRPPLRASLWLILTDERNVSRERTLRCAAAPAQLTT